MLTFQLKGSSNGSQLVHAVYHVADKILLFTVVA